MANTQLNHYNKRMVSIHLRTRKIFCSKKSVSTSVVGGGEDLCAKHFQRRGICGCPTSIESSSQDVVAHTHILLSLHPQDSASAVQCVLRRQRILSKFGVAPLTTGFWSEFLPQTRGPAKKRTGRFHLRPAPGLPRSCFQHGQTCQPYQHGK